MVWCFDEFRYQLSTEGGTGTRTTSVRVYNFQFQYVGLSGKQLLLPVKRSYSSRNSFPDWIKVSNGPNYHGISLLSKVPGKTQLRLRFLTGAGTLLTLAEVVVSLLKTTVTSGLAQMIVRLGSNGATPMYRTPV